MAKNCTECGKQLTFRDSFVFEGRPVCKNCLRKLEGKDAANVSSQFGVYAESSATYGQDYEFKTLLGYGRFTSGLGWFIVLIAVITVLFGIMGIISKQTTGYAAALGGVIIAIGGISLVVSGQVVLCFVSIERNTRATWELLKQKTTA